MRRFSPGQQQVLLLLLIPALVPALTAGWSLLRSTSPEEVRTRPMVGIRLSGQAAKPGLYLLDRPLSRDRLKELVRPSSALPDRVMTGLHSGLELRPENGSFRLLPLTERERFLLGRKMDLNRAAHGELTLLPGIGPVRAQMIIDLRQMRGGFKRLDDLLAVKGLGPVLVGRLRPLVRFGPLEDRPIKRYP